MSSKSEWNIKDPLARCKQETRKANAALRDYAFMGPGRSLRKLHNRYCQQRANEAPTENPPTTRFRTLAKWSSKYAWQLRIEAWERIKAAEVEVLWDERRTGIREADYVDGQKLREVVQKFLDELPNFAQTSEIVEERDGQEVIVIRLKMNVSLSQLSQAVKAASDLQRVAAGLETDRRTVEIDWRKEAKEKGLDSSELFERMVQQAYAAISASNGADSTGSLASGEGTLANGGGEKA